MFLTEKRHLYRTARMRRDLWDLKAGEVVAVRYVGEVLSPFGAEHAYQVTRGEEDYGKLWETDLVSFVF